MGRDGEPHDSVPSVSTSLHIHLFQFSFKYWKELYWLLLYVPRMFSENELPNYHPGSQARTSSHIEVLPVVQIPFITTPKQLEHVCAVARLERSVTWPIMHTVLAAPSMAITGEVPEQYLPDRRCRMLVPEHMKERTVRKSEEDRSSFVFLLLRKAAFVKCNGQICD